MGNLDYDELDAFLAEDEARYAKEKEAWEEERAKIREERAEEAELDALHETVAWKAETVKDVLEKALEEARKDIAQVDKEKGRDRVDIAYRILFFIGALLIYPILKRIFGGMAKGFGILFVLYGLMAFVAIFVTTMGLLDSLVLYFGRSRLKNYPRVNGCKILTYDLEQQAAEERAAKIYRNMREVDEIVKRSELRGGLTEHEFEHLKALQYPVAGLKTQEYIKHYNFVGFVEGLFGR